MDKIICNIHLFELHQNIYFNDKQIAITSLDNLNEMIPLMCDKYNTYHVHLLGNEEYIDGLIQNIEHEQTTKYNNNKIEFEVN